MNEWVNPGLHEYHPQNQEMISAPSWASLWLSGKESSCQCRRPRFDCWIRKMSWRRKWQLIPVFLPGESMDKGAWWATVQGVSKSQTRLSNWACTHISLWKRTADLRISVFQTRFQGQQRRLYLILALMSLNSCNLPGNQLWHDLQLKAWVLPGARLQRWSKAE